MWWEIVDLQVHSSRKRRGEYLILAKKNKKKKITTTIQRTTSKSSNQKRTCETEIPNDRNLSAYWERDFQELLVTKTSFLPLARSMSRVCGTPSMSSSPFQITPDQCERATWRGSVSAEMLLKWSEERERELRTVAVEEKSFDGIEEVSEIVRWQRLWTHGTRIQNHLVISASLLCTFEPQQQPHSNTSLLLISSEEKNKIKAK